MSSQRINENLGEIEIDDQMYSGSTDYGIDCISDRLLRKVLPQKYSDVIRHMNSRRTFTCNDVRDSDGVEDSLLDEDEVDSLLANEASQRDFSDFLGHLGNLSETYLIL